MDAKLARVLVERGVIRQGTILEAYESTKSLSCAYNSFALKRYVVLGAKASDGWIFFEVASSPTERHRIRCDFVASMDGMPIERVAAAHQIKKDGGVKKTAYKRSKKPQSPPLLSYQSVPLLTYDSA